MTNVRLPASRKLAGWGGVPLFQQRPRNRRVGHRAERTNVADHLNFRRLLRINQTLRNSVVFGGVVSTKKAEGDQALRSGCVERRRTFVVERCVR